MSPIRCRTPARGDTARRLPWIGIAARRRRSCFKSEAIAMFSSPCVRVRAAFLALVIGCFAPAGVNAVHAPQTPSLDVDRMAPATLAAADAASLRDALQRSQAWLDWSRRHPTWRVTWNLRTGTAHRLYGSGLHAGGPVTDAASCEAACRALLVEHAALTGVRADALRLAAADYRLGRWYVVFEQVEDGLPVRGARADVRLTDDGAVVLFGADWHRDPACDRRPRVAPEAALATAARDLGAATDVAHELVIVPEAHGSAYAYRLVREVRFRTATPLGVWRAWVDAHSGELLERENEIRYAQLSGHVTAAIEPELVGDPFVSRPLRDTRFNVGTGTTEFGFTDADGFYDVATVATDTVNVRVRLLGRWGRVFNAQQGFATPTIDARMFPGTSRDFVWDESNSQASERDAYYHALVAHQTIKDLDPSFTGVDYQMPIAVDIFDADCNAFYDGLGINFFGQSMRCVNTARLANVVYHEYGHGITDRQYRPFAPSGAMHEGFSDYFACSIENNPLVGRGFRGPGTFLRTIDNTNRFPEDVVGEVHRDGLIIAGALWDLREALGQGATDSLFHYARYGRADNFDDYLLDVLVTDDDNGDIYDGTPRFDAIVAAFSAHGIGDYSVQITHAPEPDTEDVNKPLTLQAVILSLFALDTPTVLVHYAIDGGTWQTLALAPTGMAVREFAATIPMQPAETDIAYYITAADIQGHTTTLPAGGAAAPFTFRVGTDTTPPVIAHDALPDQPLDSPAGWVVRALVTDNLDRALAGARLRWGRNTPNPTDSLALAPGGNDTFTAAIPPAGVNLNDTFFYRLVAVDSAQTPNTAVAPATGNYAFTIVPGLARDLESNDGGLVGSGDWEWGVPVSEPQAFSGVNVWGTGLQGSYSDDVESILELGPIDLTTWTRGALVFQHWLDCESFFDGGHVQISTDGANWTTIEPSGGYPFPFVLALGDQGYSGNSQGWQRVEFELSQWVGQPIHLRFRFASDAGVTERGWFVDDIELVARQVLSVPLAVQAQSGLDSQVPVAWSAPAGIDPLAPSTPLQGYNVYRASSPDLTGAMQLNAVPVAAGASTYLDDTAVNGEVSYYAVTAVYADGESRPSAAAEGQAYVAAYTADVTGTFDVHAIDAAAVDTTITFTNTGTGFLNINIWLGEASDTSIDQVRIAYERPPGKATGTPGTAATAGWQPVPVAKQATDAPTPVQPTWSELVDGWRRMERALVAPAIAAGDPIAVPSAGDPFTLLFTDTQEGGPTPDIKELLVEENPNGETRFRITGWAPWSNPLTFESRHRHERWLRLLRDHGRVRVQHLRDPGRDRARADIGRGADAHVLPVRLRLLGSRLLAGADRQSAPAGVAGAGFRSGIAGAPRFRAQRGVDGGMARARRVPRFGTGRDADAVRAVLPGHGFTGTLRRQALPRNQRAGISGRRDPDRLSLGDERHRAHRIHGGTGSRRHGPALAHVERDRRGGIPRPSQPRRRRLRAARSRCRTVGRSHVHVPRSRPRSGLVHVSHR